MLMMRKVEGWWRRWIEEAFFPMMKVKGERRMDLRRERNHTSSVLREAGEEEKARGGYHG
jgi:hypothetical protein